MEKVKFATEMTMEEAGQVLLREREDMTLKLDKALKALRGKQVLIDTWGGIITYQLYKTFDYNFFYNCKEEILLDLKNEEDTEIPAICIKLDNIYDITINDNTDEDGQTYGDEYYVEQIKIELTNELTIRLELQF